MKTMKTVNSKEYNWGLAYLQGKSVFLIYCPQIKQAFPFIRNDTILKDKALMQDMLEQQAHAYHAGKVSGDSIFDWENYLLRAKIKCTYRLEL